MARLRLKYNYKVREENITKEINAAKGEIDEKSPTITTTSISVTPKDFSKPKKDSLLQEFFKTDNISYDLITLQS